MNYLFNRSKTSVTFHLSGDTPSETDRPETYVAQGLEADLAQVTIVTSVTRTLAYKYRGLSPVTCPLIVLLGERLRKECISEKLKLSFDSNEGGAL